jgi:hypothetical protein
MSTRSPHDRARERQDSGQQPYKDAKEKLNESQAEIQEQAEFFGEEHLRESDEERAERQKTEAEKRLRAAKESIED